MEKENEGFISIIINKFTKKIYVGETTNNYFSLLQIISDKQFDIAKKCETQNELFEITKKKNLYQGLSSYNKTNLQSLISDLLKTPFKAKKNFKIIKIIKLYSEDRYENRKLYCKYLLDNGYDLYNKYEWKDVNTLDYSTIDINIIKEVDNQLNEINIEEFNKKYEIKEWNIDSYWNLGIYKESPIKLIDIYDENNNYFMFIYKTTSDKTLKNILQEIINKNQ